VLILVAFYGTRDLRWGSRPPHGGNNTSHQCKIRRELRDTTTIIINYNLHISGILYNVFIPNIFQRQFRVKVSNISGIPSLLYGFEI
jgi:hypothetical protein